MKIFDKSKLEVSHLNVVHLRVCACVHVCGARTPVMPTLRRQTQENGRFPFKKERAGSSGPGLESHTQELETGRSLVSSRPAWSDGSALTED